jgi:hypothetical protein
MKPSTNRIRIELTFGALSLRDLATRCGIKGPRATQRLAPYLWQMEYRTREVVKIPGAPNRYRLARQHTALLEAYEQPRIVAIAAQRGAIKGRKA